MVTPGLHPVYEICVIQLGIGLEEFQIKGPRKSPLLPMNALSTGVIGTSVPDRINSLARFDDFDQDVLSSQAGFVQVNLPIHEASGHDKLFDRIDSLLAQWPTDPFERRAWK